MTISSSSSSAEFDKDEVLRVATLLDRAAAELSPYRRSSRAKDLLLTAELDGRDFESEGSEEPDYIDEFDDEDEDHTRRLPLLDGAAWAAMRYHIDLTVDGNKERVRLEPEFKGPDGSNPPDTDNQKREVIDAWVALAGAVETPAARATMSHLAFQAGAPEARSHAQTATVAYLQMAQKEARSSDAVEAARVAIRLARAVGDQDLHGSALRTLEKLSEKYMTGGGNSVGAARAALGTLIREESTRARELVEAACAKWGLIEVGQSFWHLKLKTAVDDADREQIWRDRVESAIQIAESTELKILKAARFRDVLALAESSGIAELRERAAVLVQGIRNMDLEMVQIKASSYRFDEQFEEMVASVLGDSNAGDFTQVSKLYFHPSAVDGDRTGPPTWYRRLLSFAQFGPPTGNPDENRSQIANQYRLAPLQHLFPTQLQTPEGLPLYAPKTEDERFELDMVRWETQLLEQWTYIYAEALHRVIDPVVPPYEELARVLSEQNKPSSIGRQLADSFYRYWAGDGQAALYTAVPMIEAIARGAVLRADRGIYRLQKKQTPGQYVGLGVLLDLIYDIYQVDETDQRFFNALFKHPGGWNLRNLTSHGYLPSITGSFAAIALYAAIRLLVLTNGGASPGDADAKES